LQSLISYDSSFSIILRVQIAESDNKFYV
jgi:hypothetical protein